ncbi:MAG: hypothetical protein AAF970_09100 [Bacteroidota bacterium]
MAEHTSATDADRVSSSWFQLEQEARTTKEHCLVGVDGVMYYASVLSGASSAQDRPSFLFSLKHVDLVNKVTTDLYDDPIYPGQDSLFVYDMGCQALDEQSFAFFIHMNCVDGAEGSCVTIGRHDVISGAHVRGTYEFDAEVSQQKGTHDLTVLDGTPHVFYSDNSRKEIKALALRNGSVAPVEPFNQFEVADLRDIIWGGRPRVVASGGTAYMAFNSSVNRFLLTRRDLADLDQPATREIYLAESADGVEWSNVRLLELEGYDAEEADFSFLAADPQGHLHMVWGDHGQILGGFAPSTTSSPDALYYARSLDQGATWSVPRSVPKPQDAYYTFPVALAVSPRGTAVFVFESLLTQRPGANVYYATWAPEAEEHVARLDRSGLDASAFMDEQGTLHLVAYYAPANPPEGEGVQLRYHVIEID